MPHEIAGITECRICGRKFAGPAAIILGQTRSMSLLEKMQRHIEEAHPDHEKAISIVAGQYVGLLRFMNYKTSDSGLARQGDMLRWAIHQQTIAARISDETIKTKTAELAKVLAKAIMARVRIAQTVDEVLANLDSAVVLQDIGDLIQHHVAEIITGMRDVMQEPGKYPANNIGEAPAGAVKPVIVTQ